jgi:hypothetical protein
MDCKFLEIDQGQYLLAAIKEADQTDNLFIDGWSEFMQWSVSQNEVTKEF